MSGAVQHTSIWRVDYGLIRQLCGRIRTRISGDQVWCVLSHRYCMFLNPILLIQLMRPSFCSVRG